MPWARYTRPKRKAGVWYRTVPCFPMTASCQRVSVVFLGFFAVPFFIFRILPQCFFPLSLCPIEHLISCLIAPAIVYSHQRCTHLSLLATLSFLLLYTLLSRSSPPILFRLPLFTLLSPLFPFHKLPVNVPTPCHASLISHDHYLPTTQIHLTFT